LAYALLGALLGAGTAWLTVDKAATDERGARWVVAAGVFLVALVLVVLKFRTDLDRLGP
jgi:hypothetical protein